MRLMVDIETLSTDISNAVILSVGAVEFDFRREGPQIGTKHLWAPSLREQFALGRLVSGGTTSWWAKQSAEARNGWAYADETRLLKFLAEFRAVCARCDEIWANGIVFDLGNLETLFGQLGSTTPWRYNAARDERTMRGHLPMRRQSPAELLEGLVPHDPLSDCVQQICRLWERWPEFNEEFQAEFREASS